MHEHIGRSTGGRPNSALRSIRPKRASSLSMDALLLDSSSQEFGAIQVFLLVARPEAARRSGFRLGDPLRLLVQRPNHAQARAQATPPAPAGPAGCAADSQLRHPADASRRPVVWYDGRLEGPTASTDSTAG